MYEKELEFLNKHLDLLDNNKWIELFNMVDDIDWTGDMWVNILTIFYDKDVNIDPLYNIGEAIPSQYFFYFNGLPQNFKIPDSIKIIKSGAFEHSNIDSSLIFPDNLKEIKTNAFIDCKKLKTIILPESLDRIEFGAFDRCTNLEKVILPLNLVSLERAFDETKLDSFYVNTDDKSKVFPQGIYDNYLKGAYNKYDIVSNITGEIFGKLEDFLIK